MHWNRGHGRIMRFWLAAMMLFVLADSGGAQQAPEAFPPPDKDMARHVLWLEAQEDEQDLQVELIIGQIVEVDAVNTYRLGGSIEEETVSGWGYPRYMVRSIGPLMGTLMAIDPDAAKMERFIPITSSPYLIRYNSRLPVVIYVPEGTEVRYRIWRAEGEGAPVSKG